MFSQFFGNYLLKRGLITASQLREVLALQDSVRVKLGVMAIDAGYMNAEQVERTNALQARRDKRFGEIAIEEGYLDEDQLSELLGQQNKRHLLISQALIDKDLFGFEEIQRVLEDYRRDSGLGDIEFEALKRNDVDTVTRAMVKLPDLGDPKIYGDYFSLFVRNLIRFIDDGIVLGGAERVRESCFETLVHQEMDGRFKIFTSLAGSREAMSTFAARFAKTDIEGYGELAADSLGEFLNTQNGLFLSKLSNEWVELELSPSESRTDGVLKSVGVVYAVPFSLPFGHFTFYMGLGSPVFK